MGAAVSGSAVRFNGRSFTPEELSLIREVVASCSGLSRAELANTVCELLGWQRSRGALKARECWEFLELLDARGVLRLPEKRLCGRPRGRCTLVPMTQQGDPSREVGGELSEFEPVVLDLVQDQQQRLVFRELMGRHHYLGFAVPFGAHLRYLVHVSRPERMVVGCVQFSSPAWRMKVRDRWIGWDDRTRGQHLQRVVNNSRFLILPWVRIRNLASTVLSLAARRLRPEWRQRYGVEPLLLETLVDHNRYTGACYRAANWIDLGLTTGRGRMDRENRRYGMAPKKVMVYPLVKDARRRLRES
jgi:hypothetical protein